MRKSLAFCRRKNTKSRGNNRGKHSRDSSSRRNSQPLRRDQQLKLHSYVTVQAPWLPPPPTSFCFFVRSPLVPPSLVANPCLTEPTNRVAL